jgi:hypothetical protein
MFGDLNKAQQQRRQEGSPEQSDFFRTLRNKINAAIDAGQYQHAVDSLSEYISALEMVNSADRREWIRSKVLFSEYSALLGDFESAGDALKEVLGTQSAASVLSIVDREKIQIQLAIVELGNGNPRNAYTLARIERDPTARFYGDDLQHARVNSVHSSMISWASRLLSHGPSECSVESRAFEFYLQNGELELFSEAYALVATHLSLMAERYDAQVGKVAIFEIQSKLVRLMEETKSPGGDSIAYELPDQFAHMALQTAHLALSLGRREEGSRITEYLLSVVTEMQFDNSEFHPRIQESLAALLSQLDRYLEARKLLSVAKRGYEESYYLYDACRCDIEILKILFAERRVTQAYELQSRLEAYFREGLGKDLYRAVARGDSAELQGAIEGFPDCEPEQLEGLLRQFYHFRLAQITHWAPPEAQKPPFNEIGDQLAFLGAYLKEDKHLLKVAFARVRFSHESAEAMPNSTTKELARILTTHHGLLDPFLTLRSYVYLANIYQEVELSPLAADHFKSSTVLFEELQDSLPLGVLAYVKFGRGKYYALLGDAAGAAYELQGALTALRKDENVYSPEGKEVVSLYLKIAHILENFDKIEELEGILGFMEPS